MYGTLTCQTVVAIMLNFIKTKTNFEIAAVALRPHEHNVDFAKLLIKAGEVINVKIVVVPMYLGPLTEILLSRENDTTKVFGILDIGVKTTDFCLFTNCKNNTNIIANNSIDIGNNDLTAPLEKLIKDKVGSDHVNVPEDFILKVKKSFCGDAQYFQSDLNTIDDSYEIKISYEEYRDTVAKETQKLCEFISNTTTKYLGDLKIEFCEVVGSGWRPSPVLNEIKKCVPIQTHLNGNNSSSIGCALYLSLLLEPKWRKSQIDVNHKKHMIAGDQFSIELPDELNNFYEVVFTKEYYLMKNENGCVTLDELTIHNSSNLNGNNKYNEYKIFEENYRNNSEKFSNFLWEKAKINLNNKKRVLGTSFNKYQQELENVVFGDIEALKQIKNNIDTEFEAKKTLIK
ncbi:hypothetical protein EIN_521140 [Entamoeba invadens IP1]|uniref:Uncharacterized protein n=1 Tax=Entamoeba invadens IP1 TaxID=370355 RepID=A0A0A1U9M1_ENTIV|nr:hypothetical protein EIN_521140 [Entamoeba invadens IP1]ELP91727.1 hypothetical protein EIN_521140 [Entamoeba invadens IP1]|eukprot:XP_004258498.1 hypothetical protein EIN_521140 [Entamoeba invadens IP1]